VLGAKAALITSTGILVQDVREAHRMQNIGTLESQQDGFVGRLSAYTRNRDGAGFSHRGAALELEIRPKSIDFPSVLKNTTTEVAAV
jgi:hypothetical protein